MHREGLTEKKLKYFREEERLFGKTVWL